MNVTITGLPCSAASETGAPFWSRSAKAGARCFAAPQLAAAVSLTAVDLAIAGDDVRVARYAPTPRNARTSARAPSSQRFTGRATFGSAPDGRRESRRRAGSARAAAGE